MFWFPLLLGTGFGVVAVTDAGPSLYGSKTPYNTSVHIDWQVVLQEQARLAPTCKLFHLRMVARHGTRSPDVKNIEAVKKALKRLADPALPQRFSHTKEQQDLLNALLAWKNYLPDGKRLMDRGRMELEYLAREYFNLMDQQSTIFLQKSAFKFHSTEIARSYDSGVAFREEFHKLLKGAKFSAEFFVGDVMKNDDHLYLHKNCPAFVTKVEKSNMTSFETKRIRLTPEAQALVDKVNQVRLGLTSNVLEWNNIFALYQMAAFEIANNSTSGSVFSRLFDAGDLEFLEYADELDNFWKKAYGHPIIADLSCSLTTKIFDTAERKIAGHPDYDAIFEFAHLETLLPVYAAFELFNDKHEDFVASAPRSFITNRKFKMSTVGPFAANFAFVFFVCPDPEEAYRNEYKVVFLVNGKPTPMKKACPNDLACSLNVIRSAYGIVTSACQPQEICALPKEEEAEASSSARRKVSSAENSAEQPSIRLRSNANHRSVLATVLQTILMLSVLVAVS